MKKETSLAEDFEIAVKNSIENIEKGKFYINGVPYKEHIKKFGKVL